MSLRQLGKIGYEILTSQMQHDLANKNPGP